MPDTKKSSAAVFKGQLLDRLDELLRLSAGDASYRNSFLRGLTNEDLDKVKSFVLNFRTPDYAVNVDPRGPRSIPWTQLKPGGQFRFDYTNCLRSKNIDAPEDPCYDVVQLSGCTEHLRWVDRGIVFTFAPDDRVFPVCLTSS